ncbi:hypothetical protein ACFW9N_40385 [Streptomyces sp. NPDC059496]|uniref:hypothetical protein n=1 Tax=Streptomyces sp. NPDC059496 TaxID=3346851 RepID=UPI0036CAD971
MRGGIFPRASGPDKYSIGQVGSHQVACTRPRPGPSSGPPLGGPATSAGKHPGSTSRLARLQTSPYYFTTVRPDIEPGLVCLSDTAGPETPSNVSALTAAKIADLKRTGVLEHLIVNIPSVDEGEFTELTGSHGYQHTLGNTETALRAGLPVRCGCRSRGQPVAADARTPGREVRAGRSRRFGCPLVA